MRWAIYLSYRWALLLDFEAAAYPLCALGVSNSLAITFNPDVGQHRFNQIGMIGYP